MAETLAGEKAGALKLPRPEAGLYSFACLAMLWSLCFFLAAGTLAAPLNKARSKLLLISFDGFRWDYDRDVDTPNLDQMARDGVKAEYVTPPYITITSPAHFTLLTGECSVCVGQRGGFTLGGEAEGERE